jgi:hypothetical protein
LQNSGWFGCPPQEGAYRTGQKQADEGVGRRPGGLPHPMGRIEKRHCTLQAATWRPDEVLQTSRTRFLGVWWIEGDFATAMIFLNRVNFRMRRYPLGIVRRHSMCRFHRTRQPYLVIEFVDGPAHELRGDSKSAPSQIDRRFESAILESNLSQADARRCLRTSRSTLRPCC